LTSTLLARPLLAWDLEGGPGVEHLEAIWRGTPIDETDAADVGWKRAKFEKVSPDGMQTAERFVLDALQHLVVSVSMFGALQK
jgi:hypothetical protein